MKVILIFLSLLVLISCKDLFQFNPNEVRLEDYERNLNLKNIEKLKSYKPGDTLKFILIGDSQRFYDEVQSFVDNVNSQPDIAFVILAGDITDFGLNKEFRWINERLSKLKVPFITVIGNHDMLGNGPLIYSQMFGPTDFSFKVGNNKFICLNTNSVETGHDGSLPNIPWLKDQLSNLSNVSQAFIVSHIPPFDPGFNPDTTKGRAFSSILASSGKVKLSLSGHKHQFSVGSPYNDGVTYLVSASMNKRSYTVVSAWGNEFRVQEKLF